MKVFITSDTHFYHKNIIKYCNRPWDTVEEMNEGLIDNWNSVVGPNDFVYHLGDFAFAKNPKAINDVLVRLNGHIHLLEGNHDHLISHISAARENFFAVSSYVVKNDILLNHFPVHTRQYENHCNCGIPYRYNLYGHVHDVPVDTENAICVCTELTDYKPVEFDYYVARFNENR